MWNQVADLMFKWFRRNVMPSFSDIDSRNTAKQLHIPENLNEQHRYIILYIDNIQIVRPAEQA